MSNEAAVGNEDVDPNSAARSCVSSDGLTVGTIVGIHRDPGSNAARWAVLQTAPSSRPPIFVPLHNASPRHDGLHVPYTGAQVSSAPAVADHTRLTLAEEAQLQSHYGLGSSGEMVAVPTDGEPDAEWMTRSEEQLAITGTEWRPYRRMRIRRVVRTEEVTRVVTVRREELVVEDEPVSAVERLEVAFGLVTPARHEDIEMVLHREEVVVGTRIVPYERVRITVAPVQFSGEVQDTVRKERIEVERSATDAG